MKEYFFFNLNTIYNPALSYEIRVLMFNYISVQISICNYQSFAKLMLGFAEALKGG